MKINILFLCIFFALCCATGCKKGDTGTGTVPVVTVPVDSFAKGADVSWLTEMEASGKKFYATSGAEQECMTLLKNLGINTIRLRVWVNPADGWNNSSDVLIKALRAKALGMRIMIDFHYSDTWADPAHQDKPAAWAAIDFATLKLTLAAHTKEVLTALKTNNITPEWVAVGNETNDGMLWPDGKASVNMSNFAQLINAGYDAVKSVFASAKVMVHVSNGADNILFRWLFDGLKSNGAKWDVIGMSLYPPVADWPVMNAQCFINMNDMVARYGKEVMIVESGMSWDSPAATNSFLTDLAKKIKLVTDNKGIGLLYWEPEAYNNWQGYTLGAFDNSGKPTIALNAFN